MFKKIALIASTLMILSGCSDIPATTTTTVSDNSSGSIAISTPSTTTDSIQTASLNPAENSVSPVDQVALEGAIKLKDQSYCYKISDTALQQKCVDQLNNPVTAESKQDCKSISDSELQKACTLQQEIDAKAAAQLASKQQQIDEQDKLRDQYVQAGDLAKCKTLTLAPEEYDCEMNILLPKAFEAKDKGVCQQASTKEIAEACESGTIIK